MATQERRSIPASAERGRNQEFFFGTYFPAHVLTNEEIVSCGIRTESGRLLTTEDIESKIGVVRRSIASERETAFAMARHAASHVVNQTGPQIDAVLFSESYPTGIHSATEIARSFHLEADDVLDIHAACSGFAVALTYLKDHEDRFDGKRILIVTSEKYSPTLSDLQKGETDSSFSQMIFADGAVAISFVYGRDLTVLGYNNYSFPDEYAQSIKMPIDYALVREPALVVPVPPSENGRFSMNGPKVYEAMRKLHPHQILETIESIGLSPDDIDLIIPHQPSIRMLDGVRKGLPASLKKKVVYDIADGNFSSASVPKGTMKAMREGRIEPGANVVFDGFGAGLYSSVVVAQIGKAA